MKKDLSSRLDNIVQRANDLSGGAFQTIYMAITSFSQARGPEAAAGLAYYAFFSLFPLLVLLVTLGSFFIASDSVLRQIAFFLESILPVSRDLVEANIEAVIQLRGAVGILGLIGLLWSGTNVFAVLTTHINRAFPDTSPRNYFQARLLALLMGGGLVAAFMISMLGLALLSFVPWLENPLLSEKTLSQFRFWQVATYFLVWLLVLLVFYSLYKWIPTKRVRRGPAFWSALAASTLWRLTASAFGWFLNTSYGNFALVYGSVGAVISLLLWIYFSSWIALFGAHLCSAIQMSLQTPEK